MKYKVYMTTFAKDKIELHLSFLSNVSYHAAEKLKSDIEEYINLLIYFPRIGRIMNSKRKILSNR